jgi:hypothetical protein
MHSAVAGVLVWGEAKMMELQAQSAEGKVNFAAYPKTTEFKAMHSCVVATLVKNHKDPSGSPPRPRKVLDKILIDLRNHEMALQRILHTSTRIKGEIERLLQQESDQARAELLSEYDTGNADGKTSKKKSKKKKKKKPKKNSVAWDAPSQKECCWEHSRENPR